MSDFLSVFTYGFVLRAFFVGICISLCASLLGVTLVLKRYSMIGDGLSHLGFGAMTVALALNVAPLYVAVPVMFVAAYLLLKLRENSRVNGDSMIAVISTSAIAVGVVAASLAGGMNMDVYSYMFGSILSVSALDGVFAAVLALAVGTVYILLYNRIFAVTFDEAFASATGTNTKVFNVVLAMLSALVVVVGMRIMGAMLISGLMIFPAITAMRLFSSYKRVTVASAVISVIAFVVGMILSCAFSFIPAGAGVVLANLILLLASSLIAAIKGR